MTDQEFITVSEPAKASFTITADNRLIWHDPMPVADHSVILAATDVVANHYGLVRRELLDAAEAKLTKAMEALKIARVYVANNAQGWSADRSSARADLRVVEAMLAELGGGE